MKQIALALLAAGLTYAAWAQDAMPTPDKYTPSELMTMEKELQQKAGSTGLATETLKKYASDYSMLAYRNKSGQAELHKKFADFYYVLQGEATLVSGGHMVNGKTTAPGEVRADSIQDGKEMKLGKGDVVHVPPNIPHQLILANGATFQYFIIKVQEIN